MTNWDIIILLAVVVLIFRKLFSLLGSTPANQQRVHLSKDSAEKLYNILIKEAEAQKQQTANEEQTAELVAEQDETDLSDMDKTLRQIPNFNKAKFVTSAKNAFQIITEAFNKGDVETLEMLVSKNILKTFRDVIDKREKEHLSTETEFICFNKAEIISATITEKGIARLGVEFVSEQINVLRDAENNVIEGDENYIQNITDVWTFEKALTSTAPNWILVSTKK